MKKIFSDEDDIHFSNARVFVKQNKNELFYLVKDIFRNLNEKVYKSLLVITSRYNEGLNKNVLFSKDSDEKKEIEQNNFLALNKRWMRKHTKIRFVKNTMNDCPFALSFNSHHSITSILTLKERMLNYLKENNGEVDILQNGDALSYLYLLFTDITIDVFEDCQDLNLQSILELKFLTSKRAVTFEIQCLNESANIENFLAKYLFFIRCDFSLPIKSIPPIYRNKYQFLYDLPEFIINCQYSPLLTLRTLNDGDMAAYGKYKILNFIREWMDLSISGKLKKEECSGIKFVLDILFLWQQYKRFNILLELKKWNLQLLRGISVPHLKTDVIVTIKDFHAYSRKSLSVLLEFLSYKQDVILNHPFSVLIVLPHYAFDVRHSTKDYDIFSKNHNRNEHYLIFCQSAKLISIFIKYGFIDFAKDKILEVITRQENLGPDIVLKILSKMGKIPHQQMWRMRYNNFLFEQSGEKLMHYIFKEYSEASDSDTLLFDSLNKLLDINTLKFWLPISRKLTKRELECFDHIYIPSKLLMILLHNYQEIFTSGLELNLLNNKLHIKSQDDKVYNLTIRGITGNNIPCINTVEIVFNSLSNMSLVKLLLPLFDGLSAFDNVEFRFIEGPCLNADHEEIELVQETFKSLLRRVCDFPKSFLLKIENVLLFEKSNNKTTLGLGEHYTSFFSPCLREIESSIDFITVKTSNILLTNESNINFLNKTLENFKKQDINFQIDLLNKKNFVTILSSKGSIVDETRLKHLSLYFHKINLINYKHGEDLSHVKEIYMLLVIYPISKDGVDHEVGLANELLKKILKHTLVYNFKVIFAKPADATSNKPTDSIEPKKYFYSDSPNSSPVNYALEELFMTLSLSEEKIQGIDIEINTRYSAIFDKILNNALNIYSNYTIKEITFDLIDYNSNITKVVYYEKKEPFYIKFNATLFNFRRLTLFYSEFLNDFEFLSRLKKLQKIDLHFFCLSKGGSKLFLPNIFNKIDDHHLLNFDIMGKIKYIYIKDCLNRQKFMNSTRLKIYFYNFTEFLTFFRQMPQLIEFKFHIRTVLGNQKKQEINLIVRKRAAWICAGYALRKRCKSIIKRSMIINEILEWMF